MKNVFSICLLLFSCHLFSQSSCLEFDGNDDYISSSSSALDDIDSGDFTLMAWVKGLDQNQPSFPMILSNRETEGPGCLFFFHNNFGGSQYKLLSLQLDGFNYFLQNEQADLNILDGEYHQVAISKGNGIVSFYSDGILLGTKGIQQNPTTQTFHEIWIGQDDPTNNTFNGNLSNISIWNKVLTPQEILLTTCSEDLINEDGLVAFWPLNEGAGQEVTDLTNGEIAFLGGSTNVDQNDPIWDINCSSIICTVEICDDGIDNDGDGLIDCEDEDCYLNNSDECISCLGNLQTFADVVLSYSPECPEDHDPIVINPENAIGAPNYELPLPGQAFGTGFVSLGEGGSVELGFVDNVLVNSGNSDADLYVFEVGTDIESMIVDLRPIDAATISVLEANGYSDDNSDGYYEIATIAGATSSLDLDALLPGQTFGTIKFDAIILTDLLNNAGCLGSSGADIDAVCALTSMPAEICDNGIDDDGDGFVDCADPDLADDCCCAMIEFTLDLGEDQTICQGQTITLFVEGDFISYSWQDGTAGPNYTITTEGLYWVEVIDECDNIQTDSILVTLDDPIFASETAEICDGESIIIKGQTYDAPGTYEQIISSTNTCDTLLTITVTEGESFFITEMAEICDGETVEINGQTYTSAGIYEQVISSDSTCDTILTITINVGAAFEVTETYTINSGESIETNGETFSESGIYIQNLSSSTGCDSILTIIVSVNQNIVHYDFEDCISNSTGESTIYTEFAATYPEPLDCGTVQATNVYRENPTMNGHSCTEGVNQSIAMCVSSHTSCDYITDSDLAVRFEVDINPDEGFMVQLGQLSFYEKAPEVFAWIDGNSGPNNYPTLYGIRILLNNQTIYEESEMDATSEWSLEQFDLSGLISDPITSQSILAVELIGYCATSFVSNVTAWDIDDVNLSAICSPINNNRTVAGSVTSATGDVIANVTVKRKEVENSTYQNVGSNGQYAFESDINTEYQLSARKVDQKMKGVSTKDIIIIQNHLLGFSEFEHAYQYIAADINNSNHISGLDLITLRKLVLGVTSDYPNSTSWTFVEPSDAGANPWTLVEQLNVPKGPEHSMDNNFIAIKIGDVSDVADNGQKTTSEIRSVNSIKLEVSRSIDIGNLNQQSSLDFYSDDLDGIYGFQLSLNLNGIEVTDLTSELINITKSNYHIVNDQLTISWSGSDPISTSKNPLFTIVGGVSDD